MRKGLVSTSPFPFSDSLSSMLNLLLLLLVLGPPANGCESAPEGLTQAVTAYWHALEKHDKVTAMQFVYSEDLNSFLNRQDADLRNTQCVGINLVNDETAKVLVSFDRAVLQTYLKTEATDTWVKTEQGWKVRVEKPASVTDRIYHAIETMPRPPLPARLDVLPKRLAFYAISPQQTAPLQIRNGLDLPAEVVSHGENCVPLFGAKAHRRECTRKNHSEDPPGRRDAGLRDSRLLQLHERSRALVHTTKESEPDAPAEIEG